MPLHIDIFGRDGKMTQPWAFFFQEFFNSLPPGGSGFVIDGTSGTYGEMTLSQGPDIFKGNPGKGDIYFALDSGKIYVERAGQWVVESPAYTGDVTKPANSTVLSLVDINASPGTWGSKTEIPVFTVDEKGRIVAAHNEPVIIPDSKPGGLNGAVQFNADGSFAGVTNFTYNPNTNTLTYVNGQVTGAISFTNPAETLNNLSPLTTKGDLLTKDGLLPNNHISVPVGTDGQVLTADSTTAGGFIWKTSNDWSVDTTDLLFDSPEIVGMFTLPANALVDSVILIVDEQFDGVGATATVGISATPNKYIENQDVMLSFADRYEVPHQKVVDTFSEALKIYYTAAGSTKGKARVIVNWCMPS